MFSKLLPIFEWIKKHKYLSVTIVFLLIIFVFDDNNLFKHFKNQAQISNLKKEIAEMKRDSMDIVNRQKQLDFGGDVEVIEDLAREKYGMHKDNEDVFVIE